MTTAIKYVGELAQQVQAVFEVGNITCGLIGKLWKFPIGIDQNVNNLKRKRDQLNNQKDDVESRIIAELRPRKKVKKEVNRWLENVQRIDGEVHNLESKVEFSSFFSRGFLVNNVCSKEEEIQQLIQQGRQYHEDLVVDNPPRIGQELLAPNLLGESTRARLEEIWWCLMDDEIPKIGVWGKAGVGKTSTMKVINNQLVKEIAMFDTVIWITVSKETSIAKLQKDIASQIKVTFCGDESETIRAGMISETLSRKRFVMILDDIWEKISLETVGIPETSSGKLMLTTRSFDVCRQMGFKEIKVNPLEEEEAWDLFLEKVGRDILNIPGVESIAKQISERCAGLPLTLIHIATSMKGIDNLSEWGNALKELSEGKNSVGGLEDEVFQQLRFSYDRITDPILQACFFYSTLCPESAREEDLIRLWIAEGFVKKMDSRQSEFDKGRAIIDRLRDNCFLQVCTERDDGRSVKMHALVRDMALRMISEFPQYLVKAGMRLTEPPDVQEWNEELEKTSLMKNWELQVLYPLNMPPPKCPNLATLLLSDCDIRSIPENFFKHMQSLKILDLSRNRSIKSLPSSLSNLKNLIALLLSDCGSLENVPSLSNLQVLEELNLEGTNIMDLPHGMQNLLSLQYLNLRQTRVYEIPNGMLSRFSCLQNLNVGDILVSGEEVGGLKKLEIFEGRFYDLHNLNTYVQVLNGREQPREYAIRVGRRKWFPQRKTRKCIELSGFSIYADQIMLPSDIEELYVDECNLHYREEYTLSSRFIQASLGSFSSLKFLQISNCRNMKKLFSPNSMPLNLEQLTVDGCHKLEEIIASEVGPIAQEFRLRQLKVFSLCHLPELKRICSADGAMVCDSLDEIWVVNCPKLRRMPLHLPQVDNVGPSPNISLSLRIKPMEWWESVEWDHPNAKSLLEPFLTFW
ncbi:hypothetical protein F3Y22_tig00111445pilonHSYRG00113 [Hibiscus syriacus]|uniref:Uncharacterized protein n=1 Tax=Hibiscus syriacus TaxID=106335 RepID=A0A6A2XR92_HIBSY|nr:probable disease resistance protein At1g61300 [Hibiscus syriacus]KAE8678082.1 hypothetical protein F3Y22_tig00111445pilonHSYRG00113 [Hibiscus syriacus]